MPRRQKRIAPHARKAPGARWPTAEQNKSFSFNNRSRQPKTALLIK